MKGKGKMVLGQSGLNKSWISKTFINDSYRCNKLESNWKPVGLWLYKEYCYGLELIGNGGNLGY